MSVVGYRGLAISECGTWKGEKTGFSSACLKTPGGSSNLKFGEHYKIQVQSVEERREIRVINTRVAGPTVKISRASMESWALHEGDGAKNERRVVDLRFSNVARPEQPAKRYFAVYDPRREELNLRIRRTGARPGDVLRLQERREYRIERFLRDFETHKLEALNNVALRMEKEGLLMKVDERSFPLSEPRLDARGLKAILTAKIGRTHAPIRFAFDGEKATMKLFDDAPVTGLKSEHGLAIRYDQGGGASRTFRLLDAFRRETLDNRIRLVSIPEGEQGAFHLKTDSWLAAHVRDRLARCNGGCLPETKGRRLGRDLSLCSVACAVLEGDRGSSSSEGSARRQARYYLKRFPTYRGEKVVGAFIGFLDWNVKSNKIEFDVDRVFDPSETHLMRVGVAEEVWSRF